MLNPHVHRVHVPAHVVGAIGLWWGFQNPSWGLLLSFLLFNLWFSGLGMSVGYHRYFTHRAFKTNRFWHLMMLFGGTLAGQGSVIFWAALHRVHHPTSDQPTDPHTPRYRGLFHAYMGWIFDLDPSTVKLSRAVDLIRDSWCAVTHRLYHYILWLWWGVLALIGGVLGLPEVAAGAAIAGCWSIHQEALINSFCHDQRFGSRSHETPDSSRNVRALEYITWGQSLHNTHHAFPARADFGDGRHDIGFRLIQLIRSSA